MDSITQHQSLIIYLYVHRKEGGRGMIQRGAYIAEVIKLMEYV
jgi:hypothetical protein